MSEIRRIVWCCSEVYQLSIHNNSGCLLYLMTSKSHVGRLRIEADPMVRWAVACGVALESS